MEAFALAIEGFALAEWFRYSRWGYALLNASHILGITLLVGASITLDLRLFGLWRPVDLGQLYRPLSSVAASGLILAVVTGLLLFSVRATDYIQFGLFFFKIGLVILGAFFALFVHRFCSIDQLSRGQQRIIASISLLIWLSVLVSGRLIAFL